MEILHNKKQDLVYIVEILEDAGMFNVFNREGPRTRADLNSYQAMKTEHVEFARVMFESLVEAQLKKGYVFVENKSNIHIPALETQPVRVMLRPKKEKFTKKYETVERARKIEL